MFSVSGVLGANLSEEEFASKLKKQIRGEITDQIKAGIMSGVIAEID